MADAGEQLVAKDVDAVAVDADGSQVADGVDQMTAEIESQLALRELEVFVQTLDLNRIDEIGVGNFEGWIDAFTRKIADPRISVEGLQKLLAKFRANSPSEADSAKAAGVPIFRSGAAVNALFHELTQRRFKGEHFAKLRKFVSDAGEANMRDHFSALVTAQLLPGAPNGEAN